MDTEPTHTTNTCIAPTTTTPAPGPLNLIRPYAPAPAPNGAAASLLPPAPAREFLRFHSVDYFSSFTVPEDAILLGDCHLTRGGLAVIAGVPGCGKSRLVVSLAIAGRQGPGATWMGLPVHARFKTAILQAENGELRLKNELGEIAQQGHDLQDWLYITPPPAYGLAFNDPDFLAALRNWLGVIQPGVLAIDPWNRCVMDDKAKDFRATLDAVRAALPAGQAQPAIVIVHHLRKQPGGEGRKRGRDLLPELSGSHVIGSACRAAFILEPASADGSDDRVIFTCAKNNDGSMGAPSAWRRKNGLFEPCEGFDVEAWIEGEGPNKKERIALEDLAVIFEDGARRLTRRQAVNAIIAQTDCSQASAYDAIRQGGRFAMHLREDGGLLHFRA